MNKVLLLSVLFSFGFKSPVQIPKKVALIIQNTLFNHKDPKKVKTSTNDISPWRNLEDQGSNASQVKSLLIKQGFLTKNIVVKKNLTAQEFRNTIESFIKNYVATGAICVVYISSIGTRIKDGNGDEQDLPLPKEDEVIICTDSPDQEKIEIQRNAKEKDGRSIDYHPKAIIDDEIGTWNDSIRSKIGPSGHYLLLADFCNSDGANRGEEAESITDLQTTAQPLISKTDNLSVFLLVAASTKEIFIHPAFINSKNKDQGIGYYVKALKYTLNQRKASTQKYQKFFDIFKDHLIKLGAFVNPKEKNTKDSGVPVLIEGHIGIDAQKLVFDGF